MMEITIFTLNAIVVYLVADRIVRLIETKRGEALKRRQVVFFVIFLTLALLTFNFLQTILQTN